MISFYSAKAQARLYKVKGLIFTNRQDAINALGVAA